MGVSKGPSPWWQQTPGWSTGPGLPQSGLATNLEQSAPPGYTYDKIKMAYVKTPTQAGSEQNQFNEAANPSLAALLKSMTSGNTGINGGASTAMGGFMGGSASGGTTSGGGTGSGVPGGGMATIPGVELPDQTAATAARFATAKDKVGQIGRASIDALRGELGATGGLGGGAEVQGVRDVVQSGAGELGQVSRDEAIKQADLGADFAKTRYSGSIAQRGQDVSAREAEARLAQEKELAQSRMSFEQQQQKSSQQLQLLQMALGGLKSMGTNNYEY